MAELIYTLTEQFPRLFRALATYAPDAYDYLMQWYPQL